MRDILFRGKSKDTGEWVYGSLVHQTQYYGLPVDYYHILYDGEFHADYYGSTEVFPETVGQFTGLFDKNGKKIFEGDILKGENWLHRDHNIHRVVYHEGGFYLIDKDGDPWHHDHVEDIEVIGNIHDNPELLKGEGK